MRLKNKISIAFSIAKWNRRESFWQQGKEENKKNMRPNGTHRSIAYLNRILACFSLFLRRPQIVQHPVGIGFLAALAHISAERAVIVAHISATGNTVHTALDDAALLQQPQYATADIVLAFVLAPLRSNIIPMLRLHQRIDEVFNPFRVVTLVRAVYLKPFLSQQHLQVLRRCKIVELCGRCISATNF